MQTLSTSELTISNLFNFLKPDGNYSPIQVEKQITFLGIDSVSSFFDRYGSSEASITIKKNLSKVIVSPLYLDFGNNISIPNGLVKGNIVIEYSLPASTPAEITLTIDGKNESINENLVDTFKYRVSSEHKLVSIRLEGTIYNYNYVFKNNKKIQIQAEPYTSFAVHYPDYVQYYNFLNLSCSRSPVEPGTPIPSKSPSPSKLSSQSQLTRPTLPESQSHFSSIIPPPIPNPCTLR